MQHSKTDVIKHDSDNIKLTVKVDHDSHVNINFLIDAIRQVCNLIDNRGQFKLDLDVEQYVTFMKNTVNCPDPNTDVDMWSIGIMTEHASIMQQSTLSNMIQTNKKIGVKFFEIPENKKTSEPEDDPDFNVKDDPEPEGDPADDPEPETEG